MNFFQIAKKKIIGKGFFVFQTFSPDKKFVETLKQIDALFPGLSYLKYVVISSFHKTLK